MSWREESGNQADYRSSSFIGLSLRNFVYQFFAFSHMFFDIGDVIVFQFKSYGPTFFGIPKYATKALSAATANSFNPALN